MWRRIVCKNQSGGRGGIINQGRHIVVFSICLSCSSVFCNPIPLCRIIPFLINLPIFILFWVPTSFIHIHTLVVVVVVHLDVLLIVHVVPKLTLSVVVPRSPSSSLVPSNSNSEFCLVPLSTSSVKRDRRRRKGDGKKRECRLEPDYLQGTGKGYA
jgi:hypothetical protein